MNLKKIPGGSVTNNIELEREAHFDADLIRRQFEIYKPHTDLFISCGSAVTRLLKTLLTDINQQTSTFRGIEYFSIIGSGIVLEYSHPEARLAKQLLFHGIVDAVREIKLTTLRKR